MLSNWLDNGWWHERGISLLNPPAIEFPTLLSREPYLSYPSGAVLPLFLVALLGKIPVTPGFFFAWGFVWYVLLGGLLMVGVWCSSASCPEPERHMGTWLTGVLWLSGRGPLSFFPTLWYADIVVLVPFVLVILGELNAAHGLLGPRQQRVGRWAIPVLVFWGTYTDWLFLPLCAVILVYRLWQRQPWRAALGAYLWQIALPATLAVTCFALQGFWALGPDFISTLLHKFLMRSLDTTRAFATSHDLAWHLLQHSVASIGGLSLGLAGVMLLVLGLRRRLVPRPLRDFLLLLTVPGLLLLLLFRQHAAIHSFSVVKFFLPLTVLLGTTLPWAMPRALRIRLVVVLGLGFWLYEGWQYQQSMAGTMPVSTLAQGEAIRRHFGYQDVLFTLDPALAIPAVPPMQVALSRKRIYAFDAEHVARLRRDLPTARLFLLGTARALDAFCQERVLLHETLYYCRL